MGWIVMVLTFAVGFGRLGAWWAIGIGIAGGATSLATTLRKLSLAGVPPPRLSFITTTLLVMLVFALIPYGLGRLARYLVSDDETPPASG